MIAVDDRGETARVMADLARWSRRLDGVLEQLRAEVDRRAEQPGGVGLVGEGGDDDDSR